MKATPSTAARIMLVAAALAASAGLTACQGGAADSTSQADCQSPTALVLVVAAHANASPGIPKEAMCLVGKALEEQKPISIIREDGQPSVLLSRRVYKVKPGSANYKDDLKKAKNSVTTTVAGIEAANDGDDPLAALSLAGDLTTDTPDATVIMLSPGLSDQPPLDLTKPALATASADEVAVHVKAAKVIPHLEGRTVMWFGLNRATGAQQQLPQPQREAYQNIYTQILSEAGAKTTFYPFTANGNPARNSAHHTIRPVEPIKLVGIDPVPAAAPNEDVTRIFDNSSAFGFLPNTTDFRDPDAAESTVKEIAAWIKKNPTKQATITGTTATDGSAEGRQQLSLARAKTVISAIGASGADTSRLTPVGAGNNFDGFVQDLVGGVLDPVKAEANRSVRITYHY